MLRYVHTQRNSARHRYSARYYRPQTKLRKGNVFTSVCQEFCPHGRRSVHPPWADTPLPRQTASAADGTHPTGILEFVLTVPTGGTQCAREICTNRELCEVFSLQSSYDKRRWL